MSASKTEVEIIKNLLSNGSFCHEAIELNPHTEDFVSGEEVEMALIQIIKDIENVSK